MATCRNCKKDRLEWRQEDNGRWWLYDPATDQGHHKTDCDDHLAILRAQQIADTAKRPVLKRGDRVIVKGFTGTVEALTKPKTENTTGVRYTRRYGYETVIESVKGDVFALIKWDDEAAYQRFKKWINTRNIQIADKT
jgi:hypothetical protein